jgi:hypothetical protein
MADKKLLQQMLEHLVNDDQAKAEELFHEYVVQQSREIYESLIDSEIAEEEDKEDDDEENKKVDEASDEDDDEENKKVDEEFEDIAIEGDDEDPDMMGGDPTDDLEGDLEMGDDDMEEKSEEELFQDLDSIVDELQAKFDELKGGGDMGDMGGDDMGGDDMGGMGDKMKDDFDLETVREYVEKVAPAKMGDNGVNTKSIVAGKNDMGGTTANILSGKNGAPGSETGELKGSGLLKGKPTEDNAGNINVPGGKAGGAFSKKEPGHGAEKAGAKESADNKQSLFRGRR